MKTRPDREQTGYILVTAVILFLLQFNGISHRFLVIAPGVSARLDEMVAVEGGRKNSKGIFMLTAVFTEQANLLSFLYALCSPAVDLTPAANEIPNGMDQTKYRRALDYQMKESQQVAIAVALRQLGYPVAVRGGVRVDDIDNKSSFYDKLRQGDVIYLVDDKPVFSMKELSDKVKTKSIGDVVSVEIARKNRSLHFYGRVEDIGGSPGLGIVVGQASEFRFPLSVDIEADDIKGSSAGIMFALEIFNQLSKKDISRGKVIAGTGSLNISGEIGTVSGVKQKVLAARRSGAEVFIVPKGNFRDAEIYAGDMKLIPASTFKECLSCLSDL